MIKHLREYLLAEDVYSAASDQRQMPPDCSCLSRLKKYQPALLLFKLISASLLFNFSIIIALQFFSYFIFVISFSFGQLSANFALLDKNPGSRTVKERMRETP